MFNGPIERRGLSLIRHSTDRTTLEAALCAYLDARLEDTQVGAIEPRFMHSSGEFDAAKARKGLAGKVAYHPEKVVKYPFKPFDMRIAYLDSCIEPLFSSRAPDLLKDASPQNWFLISRDSADKTREGPPFLASRLIADYDTISGHARSCVHPQKGPTEQHALDFENGRLWCANLSNQVAG